MKVTIGSTKGVAVVLAAGLLLGGVGAAASAEPGHWRHGLLVAKSDAGIIMMPSRGGFAEKQGLKLEIVQLKSDVLGLQALLSGELDSFEGGIGGAIKAASRGADVKIVGCYWVGLPHGIFARNDIKSVADLRGKKFAISAPGALPDILARALLDKDGVPPAEVKFVNMGGDTDRFKALVAGVADAAVVSGEYQPIAAKEGVKLLVPGREVLPNYMRLCTMMSGKTIAERHADAVRFMAAEMTGLRYALGHRDAALALTRKITGIKPTDPRPDYVFDDTVRSHAVDPDMPLPMAKIAWMQDLLIKTGGLAKTGDVAKMVDGSVRADALKMAGH